MSWLSDLINSLLAVIVSVLPSDPFIGFISSLNENVGAYLGYLNWFIPFGSALKILGAWIASIALFYIWMTLARWIKLIGD